MPTALPAVAAGPRRRRPADRPRGSAAHPGSGQAETDGVGAPGVAGWALPGGARREEHQPVDGLPGCSAPALRVSAGPRDNGCRRAGARVQLFSYSIELIYHTVVPASVVTCASSSTSFFNSARAMGESMEM